MEGITEANIVCWSHPATWRPTDDNLVVKTPWPRAKGMDCGGKSYHSRPETPILRKACLQGWPFVGIWDLDLETVPNIS